MTDIAKYKSDDPNNSIRNWMRNRETIEFLGIWERLHNPNFNPVEFDGFRSQAVLGATLCNWSCLMNSFFKDAAPNPHLHIHVRPRYDKPVMLNGNTYTDSEFVHHYGLNKSVAISDNDKEEVFNQLKEWMNR